MAETKVTKRDNFNAIIEILMAQEEPRMDLVDAMKHEIELMDNKNAKRASKKVDNTVFYEAIENALADGAKTPTELVSMVEGVENTQKIASIVKDMGDKVIKSKNGKKVVYELA